MQYPTGREVELFDPIVGKDASGAPFAGIVVSLEGPLICPQVEYIPIEYWQQRCCVAVEDCVHVDDLKGER